MSVDIIPWEDRFAENYIDLSVEWLEKYVRVEAADIEILYHPHEAVLDRGGMIFFASEEGKNIGTITVMRQSDTVCELAKLAVTEACKGRHIGQLLMEFALQYAREQRYQKAILFTNSRLLPAISLYEKLGFALVPLTDNEYEESDMRMELAL